MIFSLYALREDPDYIVFDKQRLVGDVVGTPDEYDCVGVFEVKNPDAGIMFNERVGWALLLLDEWRLYPQAILLGDWTDKDSGKTADLVKHWVLGGE